MAMNGPIPRKMADRRYFIGASGDEHVPSHFFLPSKRVGDDGGEIIILCAPPKLHLSAIASCDDLSWIAWTTRGDLDLEVNTGNALDHLNHFTHREATAITTIDVREAPPARK